MPNNTSSTTLDTYRLSSKFQSSLERALNELNCSAWGDALLMLAKHFDGVSQLLDESFEVELLEMLLGIANNVRADPLIPVVDLAAIRLSKLLQFHLRGSARTESGIEYWNPLLTSWQSFKQTFPAARLHQSADPYPPIDMIKTWARDHLKSPRLTPA